MYLVANLRRSNSWLSLPIIINNLVFIALLLSLGIIVLNGRD